MESIINGLTPLDPSQLVNITLEELRKMKIEELVGLAHQLGADVRRIPAERGKLLDEVLNHAADA